MIGTDVLVVMTRVWSEDPARAEGGERGRAEPSKRGYGLRTDAQYAPTRQAERVVGALIPLNIAGDFPLPVFGHFGEPLGAQFLAVPDLTVNKHGQQQGEFTLTELEPDG